MLTYSAPKGLRQWAEIYCLYQKAFPKSEKKPFTMIRKMHRLGKSDVWRFERDGKFAGLIITINGDEHILLDYLAVDEAQRGTGIGTDGADQHQGTKKPNKNSPQMHHNLSVLFDGEKKMGYDKGWRDSYEIDLPHLRTGTGPRRKRIPL